MVGTANIFSGLSLVLAMACIATEILDARYGSLARLSIGAIRGIDWEFLLQVVRITNGILCFYLAPKLEWEAGYSILPFRGCKLAGTFLYGKSLVITIMLSLI